MLDPELPQVYVGDAASNDVDVIDHVQGRVVTRTNFGFGVGASPLFSSGQAAALNSSVEPPLVLTVATRMRALIATEADSQQMQLPMLLKADISLPVAVAVSPEGTRWVLHATELGRIDAQEQEEIVASGLPSAGEMLAFAPDGSVLVGLAHRVAVYRPGQGLLPGLALDEDTYPDLWWLSTRPDGRVLVFRLVSDNFVDTFARAGLWDPATLAAGGAPSAVLDEDDPLLGKTPCLGVVELDGQLVLLLSSPELGPVSVALGPDLQAAGEPRPSTVLAGALVSPSPDGRFLFWSETWTGAAGHLTGRVHCSRVVDGGALAAGPWTDLPVAGNVVYDPTGERAFLPLGNAMDAIAVFE